MADTDQSHTVKAVKKVGGTVASALPPEATGLLNAMKDSLGGLKDVISGNSKVMETTRERLSKAREEIGNVINAELSKSPILMSGVNVVKGMGSDLLGAFKSEKDDAEQIAEDTAERQIEEDKKDDIQEMETSSDVVMAIKTLEESNSISLDSINDGIESLVDALGPTDIETKRETKVMQEAMLDAQESMAENLEELTGIKDKGEEGSSKSFLLPFGIKGIFGKKGIFGRIFGSVLSFIALSIGGLFKTAGKSTLLKAGKRILPKVFSPLQIIKSLSIGGLFKTAGSTLQKAGKRILPKVFSPLQIIKSLFSGVTGGLFKTAGSMLLKAGKRILLKVFLPLQIIKSLFSGVTDAIEEYKQSGSLLDAATTFLTSFAGDLIEGLTFGLVDGEMLEKASGVVTSMIDGMGEYLSKFLSFDNVESTVSSVVDIVGIVPNIIKDAVVGAVAWLMRLFGFDSEAEELQEAADFSLGELVTKAFKSIVESIEKWFDFDIDEALKKLKDSLPSWLTSYFFDDDDEEIEEKTKVKHEEESKGFFSNWFGSDPEEERGINIDKANLNMEDAFRAIETPPTKERRIVALEDTTKEVAKMQREYEQQATAKYIISNNQSIDNSQNMTNVFAKKPSATKET